MSSKNTSKPTLPQTAPPVDATYYQSIVEQQTELICRYDSDLRLRFVNKAYAEWFGRTPAELIGVRFVEMIPEDQREGARAHVASMTMQQPTAVGIHDTIMPDGSHRMIEWTDRALFAPDGSLLEYQGVGRDVTAREQQMQQLRALSAELTAYREHLNGLLDTMQDAIMSLSLPDRKLIYVSAAFERVFGYPVQLFLDDPNFFQNVVHPDDLQLSITAMQTCLREGSVELEHRIVLPDGQIRWLRRRAWVNYDVEGQLLQVNDSAHDITAQKEAQAALARSEDLFQRFMQHLPATVFILDEYNRLTYCNSKYAQSFKLPIEAVRGKRLNEYASAELAALAQAENQAVLERQHGLTFNYAADGSDGSDGSDAGIRWRIFKFPIPQDTGDIFIGGIGFDITREVQINAALRASEKRYRQMFELHGLPKLIIDPQSGQIVDANPAAGHFYGYTLTEIKTLSIFDLNLSPRAEVLEKMAKAAEADILSCEFVHRVADGTAHHVEVFTGPIEIDGTLLLYSIVTDINERVRTANALQEAHDLLEQRVVERTAELEHTKDRIEAIFNHSGDGILLLDVAHGIQQANYAFEQLFGLEVDRYFGVMLETFAHPDDVALLAAAIREVAATHETRRVEIRTQRVDGAYLDTEVSIAPVNRSNKVVNNLVCIIHDITERKQAELLVAEERNLLRTLIDVIPDFIYIKDRDGRMLVNNLAHTHSLGYANPQDVVGKTDFELFEADLASKFHADEETLFRTETPLIGAEEASIGHDGQPIWALTTKVPLRNLGGSVVGLVGITHDVSTLKANEEALRHSEKALRESREMLQTVLDTIPVRVFWKDHDLVYLGCNHLFAQDAGLANTTAIIGKRDGDLPWLASQADAFRRDDLAVITHNAPMLDYEETLLTADEQALIIQTTKLPLRNGENATIGVLGAYIDITPRKQAETALAKKYEEELLMQTYYKTLHEVTIALTRIDTLDEFYHAVVDAGLARFGFERVGLLLYDADSDIGSGTYGTDIHGQVVAEHHLRLHPHELSGILQRTRDRAHPVAFEQDTPLFANFEPIGRGENAVAALWNDELLGWLAIDNGVQHQPISQAQRDIFSLYALTVGSLLARKRAEFALRESEARYRLLADNVTDLISRHDGHGNFTFVTPSLVKLTGYSPEEILGTPAYRYMHTDDIHSLIQQRANLSQPPFDFNVTYRFIRKDGSHLWLETMAHLVRDPQTNKVVEVIAVSRDVSERQFIQQELQRVSQRLALATQAGKIGVWDWNLTADTLYWDERMFEIYDVQPADFSDTAEAWRSRLHPDDRLRLMHESQAAIHGEIPYDFEYRIVTGSGVIRHIRANALVVLNEQGAAERMVGVNVDITPLKAAEQTLRSALQQEQELGELKSRFVSMTSHEFRTPLAAILATTETLLTYRERMDQPQIEGRLEKIRQQVLHMKDIMEDVLTLARMQAQRIELRPVTADLDALCRDIVEEFDIQPGYQGRIVYGCDATPLMAEYDQQLVRQVISNLIANALKYSTVDKSVAVNLRLQTSHVQFVVRDAGIGIPPEDMQRLFEPFHRARNVGTISGTGLGLSIAKEAVELHGGTLEVESELGVGTRFTLTLPLEQGKSAPQTADQA